MHTLHREVVCTAFRGEYISGALDYWYAPDGREQEAYGRRSIRELDVRQCVPLSAAAGQAPA